MTYQMSLKLGHSVLFILELHALDNNNNNISGIDASLTYGPQLQYL